MDNLFSKNEYLKIGLASIAIIFLLLSSTAPVFAPKKAEAVVPTFCFYPLDINCLKEFTLDLIFRIAAGSLIRALTNQIIGWIQGNGGGNVGFVGNFEDEFIRQLDGRAGEFLNSLAGVNLCGNIGNLLQISLPSYPYRIYDQFRCTVTDIVDNVDSFFTNFSNGGWPAYIHMTQVPNNNPFGAYLMAFNKKIKLESAAANALHRNILSNIGFKGFQQRVATTRCVDSVENLPPGYDPSAPDTQFVHNDDGTISICFTEYVTKTPGSLVSDMLNRSVGSGYDFGSASDEISEAIEAIVSALMDELINSVQDGLFNPALANLSDGTFPPGSPSCTSDTDRPDSCACDPDAVPDPCATSCIDVTGIGNGICGGIITQPLSFSGTTLPFAYEETPYNAQIPITGGIPPYFAEITQGSLPPGLYMFEQNIGPSGFPGEIAGTPLLGSTGGWTFTVTVEDCFGLSESECEKQTISQQFTLAVLPKPEDLDTGPLCTDPVKPFGCACGSGGECLSGTCDSGVCADECGGDNRPFGCGCIDDDQCVEPLTCKAAHCG